MAGIPGNSKYVKKLNRLAVLKLLKEQEMISRQQLAERSGLTPPAVTGIVRELLTMGLVEEIGLGHSQGGRKPVKLRLNSSAGYVLGVELSSYEAVISMADLKYRPGNICSLALDMTAPEHGLAQLTEGIRDYLAGPAAKGKKIMGLGVAFPGLLQLGQGMVRNAVNLGPLWNDFPIKKILEEDLGVPVFLEVNSKAGVLAEKWFGGGRGCENLVYVNLGEGISAGVMVQGEILQGYQGHAGQIGHLVLAEEGPVCRCGNRGCLESLCGIPALMRRIHQDIDTLSDDDALRTIWETQGSIRFDDLLRVAAVSPYTDALFHNVGRYIGLALANVINLYNPEVVFLGGRMAPAMERVLEIVEVVVKTHAFPAVFAGSSLKISELGRDSAVIGACALVLREFFHSTRSNMLDDGWPELPAARKLRER